jgi:hypothetical protein
MVEQLTLQTTISLLTLISLTIGVFYYVLTLRNQNRARQIQIIRGINPMVGMEFLSWEYGDHDDLMSKYGPESNPEGWDNLMEWFRKLEEMGVYVKEGLLDIRLIYLLNGGNITKSWELLKVLLKEYRIRNNHPRWFIEAEYLSKRIIEYGEKHPELKG